LISYGFVPDRVLHDTIDVGLDDGTSGVTVPWDDCADGTVASRMHKFVPRVKQQQQAVLDSYPITLVEDSDSAELEMLDFGMGHTGLSFRVSR
jgi:hypothetical protein